MCSAGFIAVASQGQQQMYCKHRCSCTEHTIKTIISGVLFFNSEAFKKNREKRIFKEKLFDYLNQYVPASHIWIYKSISEELSVQRKQDP